MPIQVGPDNADSKRTCLVCGRGKLLPHFDVLQRCGACGFVSARLEAPLDPGEVYGAKYFCGGEYLDYRADEVFFRRNFSRRLAQVLRRCSSGRLLEIGAAYGFFLDIAKTYFDTIGYEVNEEAAHYARETFGLDLRTDDFLLSTSASIGGAVDVTVMWDVIEHLQRPDLFIAHIARLSRVGGLLYITTGDVGSLVARIRGRRWRMIHPPTHVNYFSRSTLQRLLRNYGFRVVAVHPEGVGRSLRQMMHSILVLRMGRINAYQALKRVVRPQWGLTLNTHDIMLVVAIKE